MANNFIKKEIPVVYAVDDNYASFLCVSLKSILENKSKDYFIKGYVLNTGLNNYNMQKINELICENSDEIDLEFVDVADRMKHINDKTYTRDYYTNAIYYRIFIPSLFPQYEKIIYADCDMIFVEDIARLYNVDLSNKVIAAVHEEAMSSFACFGAYSEDFLGVPKMEYFNSGLLLINTLEYKKQQIERKFIDLMLAHKFEVAPDQDYLNVLLQGKVKLLDIGWNKTPLPNKDFPLNDIKIVHYKLNFKPWHYMGIKYEHFFWKYAKKTPFYFDLLKMRETYTDKQKCDDERAFINLQKMAINYINSKNNYIKKIRNQEVLDG